MWLKTKVPKSAYIAGTVFFLKLLYETLIYVQEHQISMKFPL